MPVFNYTALKSGRDTISGVIEAESLREARESLRKLELVPTKIEERRVAVKEKAIAKKDKKEKKKKFKKLGTRDKIDFTSTLYVLSKTGIPIVEALLFIEVNSSSKNVQRLSAELRKQVLAGSNLSESITKFPETFDQIYSGLIKAGEESGELDTTLERMIQILDKQDKLKNKIKSIMFYPCFVSILAMVITLVMLTFVFPAFKDMYDQMGKELPFITQVFMDVGVFLQQYWFMIPIIIVSTILSVYTIVKWPVTKRILDKISLKIPVFRTFVRFANLSNFVSILKVSFDAGVPIVDGLTLANLTVDNFTIREGLRESSVKIQHGQSLSIALKNSEAVPGIIMCMISTGEQSGQLGDMLGQASIYIDTQLDRIIELLSKMMEPLMLVIIGGVVLLLALALYMPLFQSYSNLL